MVSSRPFTLSSLSCGAADHLLRNRQAQAGTVLAGMTLVSRPRSPSWRPPQVPQVVGEPVEQEMGVAQSRPSTTAFELFEDTIGRTSLQWVVFHYRDYAITPGPRALRLHVAGHAGRLSPR